MAPRPKRARRPKREEVRERLLAAAPHVFAHRGYAEATLEEIAAEAGFSKGAVYSNFASKEEVFFALLQEHVGARIERVGAAAAGAETLQEAGAAAGRAGAEVVDEEADWQLLFLEFVTRAARRPVLRTELARQRTELREQIATEAKEPLTALGPRPALSAAQLANVMLALSNGLAIEQLIQPEGLDPDLFERTIELLTVGLQHIDQQPTPDPS
jgi:AcrR family transcriptional regulator